MRLTHIGAQVFTMLLLLQMNLARAFFSIWLDEHTSAQRLRSQLLGLTP
jgi:hypothetical protein